MSRNRPTLLSIRPRRPEPAQIRAVTCPGCGRKFDISQRALTARCPGCTIPLRLEDLTLKQDHEGPVSTMGQVQLLSHTALTGMLVCSAFSSQGHFDGRAVVHGHVELKHMSFTAGEINGRSLVVQMGASLRARATISPVPLADDPTAIPSPVASHRPLQLSIARRSR